MAEGGDEEKTEEPTPHKLQEARKKGQIAKSKDFTSATMFLVSFFMLRATAVHMWDELVKMSNTIFSYIPAEFSAALVGYILKDVLKTFFTILGPMMVAIFCTALIVESLQTGFLISFEPLIPKPEKLNPLEGFKKYVSMKTYVELFKSMLKMLVMIFILYSIVKEEFYMVILSSQLGLWEIMGFTGGLVMKAVIRISIFYFFVAIMDLFYQRYEYMKSMKMSMKEIKDEYKRLEGDPLIKQRQKDAARQMAQGRQMGAVPQADVVVTNPVHLALALSYKPNSMKAPKVLAKGKRLVAAEIRRIATENEIPIVENPPLAQAMFPLVEVDHEIPVQYYKAVAEILAFVYNLRRKRKKKTR